jgi:hypothetical protein
MQKLEIVPIDVAADSTHKANANFDVNLVPTRTTSVDLVQQLIKLCSAASNLALLQPSTQHIGLTRLTELLQSRQLRRHPNALQIDQGHVLQNPLGLCSMSRTATKGLAK